MEQIDNYVRHLPHEQKVLYGLAKKNGEMIWEFGLPFPGKSIMQKNARNEPFLFKRKNLEHRILADLRYRFDGLYVLVN